MITKRPTDQQIEQWKMRVPARRMAEVSTEIHQALERGWIESKNLVEWLRVDRRRLAGYLADELGLDPKLKRKIAALPDAAALKQSMAVGRLLQDHIKLGDPVFQTMVAHPSDIVREWIAIVIGAQEGLPFSKRLAWIKPLADDRNSGVREVAWIGLRDRVIEDLEPSIKALLPWTGSRADGLRRYASEITRPRGVWAAHVPQLKKTPELGLPILEPLRADSSKYVRDSVANWLNDASKTCGDWVREVTNRWSRESPCPETERIIHRATRSLRLQERA